MACGRRCSPALVSVLAYNFFFLPPLYTFTIADPENVVALFFFAIVAVIASNLAARVRAQAIAARDARQDDRRALSLQPQARERGLARRLFWATAYQIAPMLKVRVVLLLPEGDGRRAAAAIRRKTARRSRSRRRALELREQSRRRPRRRHAAGRQAAFLPMRTGRGAIGVIGLDIDRPGLCYARMMRRLLDALSDQAALAIERIHLAQDIDRAQLAAETERLRSALLTSISHDLRTPLASILGSATSLSLTRRGLDAAAARHCCGPSRKKAERLNRFIANLLDMTRLESGALEPNADFVDLADVVGAALRRAQNPPGP